MSWILIAILMTPQGAVSFSDKFEYQYQCFDALAKIQRTYPGSSGSCTHL